jgi:hypothetical protein
VTVPPTVEFSVSTPRAWLSTVILVVVAPTSKGQIHAQRLIDFESVGRPGDALAESRSLGAHFVMSDRKLEHLVEAWLVRDGFLAGLGVEVGYDDGGAGDHRAARIRDIPSDFAGGVLSPSCGRDVRDSRDRASGPPPGNATEQFRI